MKDQYYLDNASTSWPKPESVYRFMDEFYRHRGVSPGRGGYEMALEVEQMVMETRRLLAQFLGFRGNPERVVFTQNATDSLNIALFGLLNNGDHVVSTRLEHNSVLRPLHLLKDQVETSFLPRDEQGYVDSNEVQASIRDNTRLVIINHASNVLGSLQDLRAIGRIVADSDALLVVDTCQSAGVVPIDMSELAIDVLTFTGHKSLYGPMGIGGLIVAEDVDIRPTRVGGTGVNSIVPKQPDEYPYRLEAGTPNIPGIAGLNAAQKWFSELGKSHLGSEDAGHQEACGAAVSMIRHKELALLSQLEDSFRHTAGVTVHGPAGDQPRVATLSITFSNMPASQAGDILDGDYHICVRTGLHCAPLIHVDEHTVEREGMVRFSLGYFNDQEDVDHVIKAVTEMASF